MPTLVARQPYGSGTRHIYQLSSVVGGVEKDRAKHRTSVMFINMEIPSIRDIPFIMDIPSIEDIPIIRDLLIRKDIPSIRDIDILWRRVKWH